MYLDIVTLDLSVYFVQQMIFLWSFFSYVTFKPIKNSPDKVNMKWYFHCPARPCAIGGIFTKFLIQYRTTDQPTNCIAPDDESEGEGAGGPWTNITKECSVGDGINYCINLLEFE